MPTFLIIRLPDILNQTIKEVKYLFSMSIMISTVIKPIVRKLKLLRVKRQVQGNKILMLLRLFIK